MTQWTGPFVWSYSPSNYSTRKSVNDNGRTVDEVYALEANGEFVGGSFGNGSVTTPLSQRDNYPLIEKGDALYAFCRQSQHTRSGIAAIAIFIVETVQITEPDDGSAGRVTYSGPGVAKELQRKILRIPYISKIYQGTTTAWNDDFVFLAAEHANGTPNFYEGGIIEVAGYSGEVWAYAQNENRAWVKNWKPEAPTGGTTETYKLYHGNATDNINQAIANAQTGWTTDTTGTPGGSFHNVNGRKHIDLINEISQQTGYVWATNITDDPLRWVFWFNSQGSLADSGVRLKKATDANRSTMISNVNYGPVLNADRVINQRSGVTRVLLSSGDGTNLAGSNPADFTVPSGFTLSVNESMLIYSDAEVGLSTYEIVEESKSFKNIKITGDSDEAKKDVRQRIINAGVNYLRDHNLTSYTYTVQTILRREASIGQGIHLEYEKLSVAGEVLWTVNQLLWLRKMSLSASGSDGKRYVTFELGTQYQEAAATGEEVAASKIAELDNSAAAGANIIITGGSGGVFDHGQLINLLADHHPQYLRTDGARQLAGDLSVADGKTIDGVDISAHAADPEAHQSILSIHESVTIKEGRNIDVDSYNFVYGPGTGDLEGTETSVHRIHLADNVQIDGILRLGKLSSFEMYDEVQDIYRRLIIQDRNGRPHFEFADANQEWSGRDFVASFDIAKTDGTPINYRVPMPSSGKIALVFTATSSGPVDEDQELFTVLRNNWSVQFLDDVPQIYIDQDVLTHTFTIEGVWIITLTTQYFNNVTFQTQYATKTRLVSIGSNSEEI